MSILAAAASPLFSTVAGGLSGIITGVLGYFQRKEDNKHALLKMDKERELLALTANIEQAKIAGAITMAREVGASAAFTASVDADGRQTGEARWATTFRAMIRPGLVLWSQLASTLVLAAAILAWFRGWADAAVVIPLVEYIVVSVVNLASMSASWYFGQRQMDKVALRWGNATAGAAVTTGK